MFLSLLLVQLTTGQECCPLHQSQITRLESRLDQLDLEVNALKEENHQLHDALARQQIRTDFKYQLTHGNFDTRETIIFDRQVFDNSNGAYDPATGVYTVGESGRYMFVGYIWMNLVEGDTFKSLRLMVNGKPVQYDHTREHTTPNHFHATHQVVHIGEFEEGDRVWLERKYGGILAINDYYNYFYGSKL